MSTTVPSLQQLEPPYTVQFDHRADGSLGLAVIAEVDTPPDPEPPDPEPEPEIDWPPGPITELAGDCSFDQLQAAIEACPQGGSVRVAPGSINLGGRSLRMKSGICLHADGNVVLGNAPGPGTAGAIDCGGLSGWAITGKGPDAQGFELYSLINASAAFNWIISNADFHDIASNGFDGSAVRIGNAVRGIIVNCDFWACGGNLIGMYVMNEMTFDGLHFNSCRQPFSIQLPQTADRAWGNSLHWFRCVFEQISRAAIEAGPSSEGAEFMSDTRVEDCWFNDFVCTDAHAMLPVSLVAQAAENTSVQRNYINRGMRPGTAGTANPGIETTGTGVCAENIIVNHAWAGLTYQSGWDVHSNVYWVAPGEPRYSSRADGWTNNGNGSGEFHDNPVASSEPAMPSKPPRLEASYYYPLVLRRRFGPRRLQP